MEEDEATQQGLINLALTRGGRGRGAKKNSSNPHDMQRDDGSQFGYATVTGSCSFDYGGREWGIGGEISPKHKKEMDFREEFVLNK